MKRLYSNPELWGKQDVHMQQLPARAQVLMKVCIISEMRGCPCDKSSEHSQDYRHGQPTDTAVSTLTKYHTCFLSAAAVIRGGKKEISFTVPGCASVPRTGSPVGLWF
jgi:hypothetical protein